MNYLLSWIIWLPIVGMLAIAFIPRDKTELIKQVAASLQGFN
jgi:NADH:ubiquinone oxidoreductase subunit 4 (subunit M)